MGDLLTNLDFRGNSKKTKNKLVTYHPYNKLSIHILIAY